MSSISSFESGIERSFPRWGRATAGVVLRCAKVMAPKSAHS
jgi:hypothetical protein